jgi:hypothetical protein
MRILSYNTDIQSLATTHVVVVHLFTKTHNFSSFTHIAIWHVSRQLWQLWQLCAHYDQVRYTGAPLLQIVMVIDNTSTEFMYQHTVLWERDPNVCTVSIKALSHFYSESK